MEAIIKTWPAFMEPRKVLSIFTHDWANYYFSVGRAKPKKEVDRIFFTHRARILGSFRIVLFHQNDGSLPKLRSLQNKLSEWQFKRDVWVAICEGPFERLHEKLYFQGFRGWRYFDLEQYRGALDSKVKL